MDNTEQQISNQNQQPVEGLVIPQSPLMRINADNQEPVRFWCLWVGIICIILLILFLAFALPPVSLILSNEKAFSGLDSSCENPVDFNADNKLYCENYSQSRPVLGLLARDMNALNQFIMLYLQIDLHQSDESEVIIDQPVTLKVFEVMPVIDVENGVKVIHFYRHKKLFSEKMHLKIEGEEDDDEHDDDRRLRLLDDHDDDDIDELQKMIALVREIGADGTDEDFFFQLTFTNTAQLQTATQKRLVGFSLTEQFTNFTFAIRYVYFFVALISAIIYLRRYFQIPVEERILQIRFVAIMSVALLFFNDPFYPATVLKPNAASAFFSNFFVICFLIFLMALWMFFLRRIREEHGEKDTALFNFRKSWPFALYFLLLYILGMVVFLKYSYYVVQQYPIIDYEQLQDDLIVMAVIGFIIIMVGAIYIAVMYILVICDMCRHPGAIMWRHNQFIRLLPVFVVFFVMSTMTGGFVPYSYQTIFILYGYSYMNIQVFLLQYLYYTPKEDVQHQQEQNEIFSQNYSIKSDIQLQDKTYEGN